MKHGIIRRLTFTPRASLVSEKKRKKNGKQSSHVYRGTTGRLSRLHLLHSEGNLKVLHARIICTIYRFVFHTSILYSRIFKRFRDMGNAGTIPRSMTSQQASTLRIPLSCLTRIPELKVLKLSFRARWNQFRVHQCFRRFRKIRSGNGFRRCSRDARIRNSQHPMARTKESASRSSSRWCRFFRSRHRGT